MVIIMLTRGNKRQTHTQLYWDDDLNALHKLFYKKYIHSKGGQP
jgi:hypothetical protein